MGRLEEITPKHELRMFWTKHWTYKTSVQDWFDCAQESWMVNYTDSENPKEFNHVKNLLRAAADKIYYEKKLTVEKLQLVKNMIYSPDPDNLYMAITIMAQLKPKKFKRNDKKIN